ncbi:MAG TPA: LacI family DNA-binding transcriptional regulator [Planctomycetota bacterium]|jgi:DNA-binding LacI/PurR family transcriptional regulator
MSIVDVAKRAHVSPATVSLVINGRPHVAPQTVLAVKNAMRALGYTPPPLANRPGPRPSARSHTLKRVALIVWDMPEMWLRLPVYVDVLHGIQSALRQRGLGLVLRQASRGDHLEAAALRDSADGLLLLSRTPEDLPPMTRGFPCVRVMGALAEEGWCDHVTYRNERIGRLAARHLLQRGHRHCAYIGPAAPGIWEERASSFRSGLESGGARAMLNCDNAALDAGGDGGRTCLAALLDKALAARPRVTGLFFPADSITATAYFLLVERGVVPGRDVDVVSCNNERSLLAPLNPPPAIIDIHADQVGRRAIEQLLWRLDNPRAPKVSIQLDPEVLVEIGTPAKD